jgi:hypothetical protein
MQQSRPGDLLLGVILGARELQSLLFIHEDVVTNETDRATPKGMKDDPRSKTALGQSRHFSNVRGLSALPPNCRHKRRTDLMREAIPG